MIALDAIAEREKDDAFFVGTFFSGNDFTVHHTCIAFGHYAVLDLINVNVLGVFRLLSKSEEIRNEWIVKEEKVNGSNPKVVEHCK